MNANPAWNVAVKGFPANASARQKLGHAVKCAATAARTEEWQPWQFCLRDEHIEMSVEAGSAAVSDDSQEREVMLRCGEALFHLKLVLKYFGCLGRVEMFPNLAQTELVAKIHHGFGRTRDAQESALFGAMLQGDDRTAPDGGMLVDSSTLVRFRDSVVDEKAWLEFSQSELSRNQLVTLAESGEETQTNMYRYLPQPDNSRFAQWARPLLTFMVRVGSGGNITVKTSSGQANEMAALAVIKTKTDDKHGWLAAGQALARIRLLTRASKISSQVFDRIFRNRRTRTELRTSIGHKGFVQAIVGFGSSQASRIWNLPAQRQAAATFR